MLVGDEPHGWRMSAWLRSMREWGPVVKRDLSPTAALWFAV